MTLYSVKHRIASKRIVELESQIDEQTCHMMPVEAGSKTIVKLDKELQEIKVALKDKGETCLSVKFAVNSVMYSYRGTSSNFGRGVGKERT